MDVVLIKSQNVTAKSESYRVKVKSILHRQEGFTLMSVMAGVGLTAFYLLILTQGLNMAGNASKRVSLHKTFVEISNNVITFVNRDQSWKNTVSDLANTNMRCLRIVKDCTPQITPSPFILKDLQNSIYINSISPSSGFTKKGIPCNTYSTSGNNDCPIRATVEWSAECDAGDCIFPNVRVTLKFYYTPDPTSNRQNLVNPNVYNLDMLRSDDSIYEELMLVYISPNDTSEGEAFCNPGSWKARLLNTELYDQGDNSVLMSATTFKLNPGTYTCTVKSPAFNTGVSSLRLYNVTDSSIVAQGPTVNVTDKEVIILALNATFNIEVEKTFEVQQICEYTSTPQNVLNNKHDFGVPAMVAYTAYVNAKNIYTKVNCTKMR